MKNKHIFPILTTTKAILSSVNVGILYSFMIKRIGKGYSTAEISFLMGYANDYMKQKEELASVGFTFEDMHCFRQAVEEQSLTGLIFNFEEENMVDEYQLIKIITSTKTEIKMIRLEKDGTVSQIFQLMEVNTTGLIYKTAELEISEKVAAMVKVLFDGQLFYSPQSALQIFQKCRDVSTTLAPRHLQAALSSLTKKNEFPKLRRTKSKDYGCMYEKVFE